MYIHKINLGTIGLSRVDTKDMENYLSTYDDFKYEGQAKCNFEDGLSEDVNFTIQLMTNGRIIGDLEFITFDHKEVWQYSEEQRRFTLNGVLRDNNIAIRAEGCYLSALSVKNKIKEGIIFTTGKAKFSSFKVVFHPENESSIPRNEILIDFGLVNVYETGEVVVNTSIGELKLGRNYDSKKLTDVMTLFRIPLITSYIRLTIQPSDSKLDDIIGESVNVVNNFLKITSLSQTVWHEWAFFIVYEKKDNSEEYGQIYRQLKSPKGKTPAFRQLYFDSSSFISTAWQGYSEDLEDKYGFSLALEWYIESNAGEILETKFLNAATCLELLMDKFHKQRGTDMLFEDEISFERFHCAMIDCARSLLKEMEFDGAKRKAVYNAMTGMKRRSFLDKCDMLLKF